MLIGALVQARMASTRLPGKVLLPLRGKPVIDWILDRLMQVRGLGSVTVVTGDEAANRALVTHCQARGTEVFCGPEDDVLERYWRAARGYHLDTIVRITGDCPFVDPAVIATCLETFRKGGWDYVSNCHPPTFPDGLDVEIFSFAALDHAHREAREPYQREHVTPYLWQNASLFRLGRVCHQRNLSSLRLTLDEEKDLEVLSDVAAALADSPNGHSAGMEAIEALLARNPSLFQANSNTRRNEGFLKSILGTLYAPNRRDYARSQAQLPLTLSRIPAGAQTLSKSPAQFVSGVTPNYLACAHGARVTDIDGNIFIDTIMGLGPVTLGHARAEIDDAVAAQMKKGIAFSLPTLLEHEVAEELARIIPCAEMTRFGKNGSDATAAAVRAARAATGREIIACCGYHGWQDWFIGATTRHKGVPRAVRNLTRCFVYNDINSLKTLFEENPSNIAGVILEPMGVVFPEKGFLESVRGLCDRHGAVLIFDEIITGFRLHLGGAQSYFNVIPDLACFGKALGNGHAVSAVTGKTSVMREFNEIFYSSTGGGDAAGLAAAKAVLDLYRRDGAIEALWTNGRRFQATLQSAIENAGLDEIILQRGYPSRSVLEFKSERGEEFNLKLKSLFQQEMAKDGVLTIGAHFMSTAHDEGVTDEWARAAQRTCQVLKVALENEVVDRLLEGHPLTPVFRNP